MYQNDSVTSLQFHIQQSVERVIDWLRESKVYDFRICLRLLNILGVVTCIKARRVITPLKFVLIIRILCDPELTCLF